VNRITTIVRTCVEIPHQKIHSLLVRLKVVFNNLHAFDVSPDGQRFLAIEPTETAQAANQINVLINWFEDLKRRVPNSRPD
jgi:hypothetical protein